MHHHHSGLYFSGGQPSVLVFLLYLVVMQNIMFLHGGVLAAPLHQTETLLHVLPSTSTGFDSNVTTTSGPPSLFSSPPDIETNFAVATEDFDNITLVDETQIHIQPSPPSIEFSELFMQKAPASFNNFIQSGGYIFESVMHFFKGLVSVVPPQALSSLSTMDTSSRGGRGLRKLDYV
jgi:hypothetical protein